MNITHRPVLLAEAVTALISGPRIQEHNSTKKILLIDGTFGRGGHTQALLKQLPTSAQMISFDKDLDAIAVAQQINDPRLRIVHDSFAQMDQYAEPESVDGILLDLGISSPQVDEAHRGFSFRREGPLDMRMDRRQEVSAETLVNTASRDELVRIIRDYGEEPVGFARRIAEAITTHRPLHTTEELAELIKQSYRGKWKKIHPATRTFQALRIAVNEELRQIEEVLPLLPKLLKQGGRVGVISFHSLEDRIDRFLPEVLTFLIEGIGLIDEEHPAHCLLDLFLGLDSSLPNISGNQS